MKLILSRKGFDSGYGGMPSPILPDGTLLSMPIPTDDVVEYKNLTYNGQSYLDILKQLKPKFDKTTCHLDPDIRKGCIERTKDWIAAFGQADAALSHLNNQDVKVGDIFLFFGWFKQTEYDKNGKLRFVKNAPDLHIIYGYLQVGKVLYNWSDIKEMYWHPHADLRRKDDSLNAIYVASDKFIDTNLTGYGTFDYSKKLVLTKEGDSHRTHWLLPKCLEHKKITYHSGNSYKEGYFKSACRGQEFVVECDEDIFDWIKNIILTYSGH